MPLSFLLAFYRNHGLLQTDGHPQWRTVTGGSRCYVEALTRPFLDRIRLSTPTLAIRRGPARVDVRTADGWERFDRVVVATHTDQALRLLEDPTPQEANALSAVAYRRNEAVLHMDEGILAPSPGARASWNCHMDDCTDTSAALHMTYDLNRLQRLDTTNSYCVTLNDSGRVRPDRVLARMSYAHPMYTVDGLEARQQLRALNRRGLTLFCGAYLGNGFHEDGVRAGRDAAGLIETTRAAA